MLRALPFAPSLGGMQRAPSPVKRAPSPQRRAFTPYAQNAYAVNSTTGQSVSSVRVIRLGEGMVATVMELKTQYAEFLDEKVLAPIYAVMKMILRTAQTLSRGPLTLKRLREMGHPYGKGVRRSLGRLTRARGATTLDVVNKQTGEFLASWSTAVEIESTGITTRLKNSSKVAQFLAFGTSKMKRHGPFSQAFLKHKAALVAAWRRVGQELRRRANASYATN